MLEADLASLPFTLLDTSQRERLRRSADLGYYAVGKILLDAGQVPQHVFLIYKGEVSESDPALEGERAVIGHYVAGDLFGGISVLGGHSRYRFRAEQETLCHLIPAASFTALCDQSPAFASYFRERLAEKTQRLLSRRAEFGTTLSSFMLARVRDGMREPLTVGPNTTIEAAVARLRERGVDSLLVETRGEPGMLTKSDLLDALTRGGLALGSPVGPLARRPLIAVDADDYLFSALVTMTSRRVTRVAVFEAGEVVGVVEMLDLLSLFSSRTHWVGLQIERAETVDQLVAAAAGMTELVEGLMAQGAKLRFVMSLLAALNARLIQRAYRFSVPSLLLEQSCLMVMGSEGRGEQVLKTDQDNALILADGSTWLEPAPEAELKKALSTFSARLSALGYPPCPGNIMVTNPAWVAAESAWHGKVARWASSRDPRSLMQLAILLDTRCVSGDASLVEALRDAIFARCSDDELLLSHVARGALRFGSGLTVFGTLRHPEHGIDIKKAGLFPIVHGVRTLALERRIAATSTFARLDALVEDGRLDRAFADDLGEALALFAELRLKRQLSLSPAELSEPDAGDRVVVQQLSGFERDLLRQALHTVKAFRQRLTHRYHLEY
ncbi:DUF294 nucleotidyltransferase-like domain-containing protein [Salinicola rhizosphaerae]|uniref:Cyclic nucleotide-binding protein n=1 Tax=Salinicola rhizosphaerae TaxID=1443141 RepID=A0ABQ3DUF2_9GAMM|nr:DUF294 nucleotidyltransferase-like domain-containing protein [Salinicola rhizosphaerae]GHB16830.1 cyclic nucleotide-binding protein [Salinicola rhizosphaerae]